MNEQHMAVMPAGTIVILTSGAYSSYSIAGVFKVLKDIDPKEELKLYTIHKLLNSDYNKDYDFDKYDFIQWLSMKNLLEHINNFEWLLEEYSNPEKSMKVTHYS